MHIHGPCAANSPPARGPDAAATGQPVLGHLQRTHAQTTVTSVRRRKAGPRDSSRGPALCWMVTNGLGACPRGPHPSRGGRRKLHPPTRHAFPSPDNGRGETPRRFALQPIARRSLSFRVGPDAPSSRWRRGVPGPRGIWPRQQRAPSCATQPRPREPAPRSVRPPLFGAKAGVDWRRRVIPRDRVLQRNRTLRGAGRAQAGSGRRASPSEGASRFLGAHPAFIRIRFWRYGPRSE